MVRRYKVVVLGAVLAGLTVPVAACSADGPAAPETYVTASPTSVPTPPPVPPHGGVNLDVLVVTDGASSVEAIGRQLTTEGIPSTVINLHDSSRKVITRAFLARTLPGGGKGGNFEGIVLPGPAPSGLSAAEQSALAWYERTFHVRQVDAYSPPTPELGMNLPVYGGLLRGAVSVTEAGASAGFGYLNGSFPFSGGAAGAAPFGYLAEPRTGRRRRAAARRGDPGFVRPRRRAGVAIRQPRDASSSGSASAAPASRRSSTTWRKAS